MAEPGYADWLQRGRTHQWEGRPVDAMLCFQRAAAIAQDGVDARYLLGEVQWQVGAIPASVAAWRDAARVDPTHLASHLALAEAHLALGEPGLARDAAERALALAPNDAAALLLRAVAAFASGHDRGALAGMGARLAPGPGRLASPAVGGALARALRAHPDAPGAIELLAALVPHTDAVAFAMLAPMAHGAFAAAAPESLDRFAERRCATPHWVARWVRRMSRRCATLRSPSRAGTTRRPRWRSPHATRKRR